MKKKLIAALICAAVAVNAAAPAASAAKLKLYVTEYGTCRVTAYSGTNGVTYGASGNTLVPNVSCAASREIPLGTQLYIDGFGIVTVEDRMSEEYDSEHEGMVVDLYLESYSAACDWGMHEMDVYIINETEEL
ncbi:MAG: 3D domain-containing protein [Ruminococcus sp.]|nr:3D domain-containing protein [Ruminococcus sp.]